MGATATDLVRALVRRGLLRVLPVGAVALVGAAALVGLRPEETQLDAARRLAVSVGLGLWLPLVCLVVASSVLGGWRVDGSSPYLAMRPVGSGRLAGTAWVVALAAGLAVGALPVVAAAGVAGGPAGLVAGIGVAAAGATAAYTSVFAWLGLRSRHAAELGLAYVLVWEGFVAEVSGAAAALSIRSNALVAVERHAGLSLQEAAPARSAAALLAVAAAGGMVLSWRALRRGALLHAS